MRRDYQRPQVYMEAFNVNRAIAACSESYNGTFKCIQGPNDESRKVISDGCQVKAGYADGVITAYNYQGQDRYKTYNAPSDSIGLMYICLDSNGNSIMTDSCWTTNGTQLVHNHTHSGKMYHVEVAPVYSRETVSAIAS